MHNLKVERFFKEVTINGRKASADGPIKTFPLRGIKDSPPYLHDDRLLTLEDTVEFFNLVLELKLNAAREEGSRGLPAGAVGATGEARIDSGAVSIQAIRQKRWAYGVDFKIVFNTCSLSIFRVQKNQSIHVISFALHAVLGDAT